MTHSSPTWYDGSIEARNYETALRELVAEQKSRVMLVALSKDVDLASSETAILTALEDHHRTFLESTLDLEDSDTYGIDVLVRARAEEARP